MATFRITLVLLVVHRSGMRIVALVARRRAITGAGNSALTSKFTDPGVLRSVLSGGDAAGASRFIVEEKLPALVAHGVRLVPVPFDSSRDARHRREGAWPVITGQAHWQAELNMSDNPVNREHSGGVPRHATVH
jgi:hypothetical protein